MGLKLRKEGPLEAIEWPTGEDVAVKRPNTYAAAFWYRDVMPAMQGEDHMGAVEALVKYTAMICPGKTEDAIRAECDEEFLILVTGYANNRLKQAEAFLAALSGKAVAGSPVQSPPSPSGLSPDVSPAPAGVPCGA